MNMNDFIKSTFFTEKVKKALFYQLLGEIPFIKKDS